MKKLIVTLYQFHELEKAAQAQALEHLRDINTMSDWWAAMYEDAENIGLKITSFDIDRWQIDGEILLPSLPEVAEKIMEEHGKKTKTYSIAKSFLDELEEIRNEKENVEDTDENRIEKAEDKFKKWLLGEYLSMLDKDFDYRCSDKAVMETIEANEYYFTALGKIDSSAGEDLPEYLETYFEMVQDILLRLDTKDSVPYRVQAKQGHGGLYELAEDWTNEFQQLHAGREWDGEFFDEVEAFTDRKNNEPISKS